MEQESTKSRPESLIGLSHHLLGLRDFSGSRKYALLARDSDTASPLPDQIVAIADVLLAAERRLHNNRPDYYSILQVARPECGAGHAILTQFKKLVTLLNPSKNRFPLCKDAFDLVIDSWSVLSKPEKKKKYDFEIMNCIINENTPGKCRKSETHLGSTTSRGEKNEGKQKEGTLDQRKQKEGTFWTVCPYCYFLYKYENAYKECCLRCQNCRRAFQAVEVGPLPPSLVVEGRDEYYCALGFFKLGYPWNGFFFIKKDNGSQNVCRTDNVVEISDDSDEDNDEVNRAAENGEIGVKSEEAKEEPLKKEETLKKEGEGIEKNANLGVLQGRLNGRRVKSTARNTKKGMKKMRRMESISSSPRVGRDLSCDNQ